MQVHVLVGCEGHVPALFSALRATATLLAPTSRLHTHCTALMPTFVKVDGVAGEKVLQANAGSLQMASQGWCPLLFSTWQEGGGVSSPLTPLHPPPPPPQPTSTPLQFLQTGTRVWEVEGSWDVHM